MVWKQLIRAGLLRRECAWGSRKVRDGRVSSSRKGCSRIQQGQWQKNMWEAVGNSNISEEGSSTITLHLGLSIVLQARTTGVMDCYRRSGWMSAPRDGHHPERTEKRGRTGRRGPPFLPCSLFFKERHPCFHTWLSKTRNLFGNLYFNCSGSRWGEEDIFTYKVLLFCQREREDTSKMYGKLNSVIEYIVC